MIEEPVPTMPEGMVAGDEPDRENRRRKIQRAVVSLRIGLLNPSSPKRGDRLLCAGRQE